MEVREHVEEIQMLSISGDPNLVTEDLLHQAAEILSTQLYPQDGCRCYHGTKSGIGFRSVFLITDEPHVFSNGYRIRFGERHTQHRNISYIGPEWVVEEEKAILSAIQSVYGSGAALPTTTLLLPLKPDKVKAVKDQLSSIHHEVVLFLSKIRHLSVREVNENPMLNSSSVSAISISSEKFAATSKSSDAVSYTVHLIVGQRGYAYYMWEQRFHVQDDNRVDVRTEVDEFVITLAFPLEQRSERGASLPPVSSFLPFPFIIQSDFILASTRRDIQWDNKWNQGILDCVPDAFVNAFTTLVKSTEKAPIPNLGNMFGFLPVNEPSHPKLNHVRDAIKEKLMNENIVPCGSCTGKRKKLYRKPIEVGWVEPAFWSILNKAWSQGMSYFDVSSHGPFLLAPSFGTDEYNAIWKLFKVRPVDCGWYAKCIETSNLVMGVSDKVYIELLVFIADTWRLWFDKTSIRNIPLIKYVGWDGKVKLLTLKSCIDKLLAAESGSGSGSGSNCISWLIKWNKQFHCPKFIMSLAASSELTRDHVLAILKFIKVLGKNHISSQNFIKSISSAKLVWTSQGDMITPIGSILFSQEWNAASQISDFPFIDQDFYGEELLSFKKQLGLLGVVLNFNESYHQLVLDNLKTSSSMTSLSSEAMLLLLRCIESLESSDERVQAVKDTKCLKTNLGYRCPSESFLLNPESEWGCLLQVFGSFPTIDEQLYGSSIFSMSNTLKKIGVMVDFEDAIKEFTRTFKQKASRSSITKEHVLSFLQCYRKLKKLELKFPDELENCIRQEKWIQTRLGDYRSPNDCILFGKYSEPFVSLIPLDRFIDDTNGFYGKEIHEYREELKELGVVTDY